MFRFIMGNEESRNSSIDFDNDAIEVTDNWTLYYARNVNGSTNLRSAFVSQQGAPDSSSDSLKKLAKNLMIHRHPSIVQFISSWSKNDSFYLITEEVKPLSQVIATQSALQICVGLHSILRALTFLHEKAQSSHNNLCCASIYVTPEGVWKLGGLDYLKKFSEVTQNYLQESRAHRYEKAVPPEEDNPMATSKINPEAIDQYAFGVLVEEVLKKKSLDEIPHLTDFMAHCKKNLRSSDPSQRSKLSEIMSHQFFNHDFIKIHKFLLELALKGNNEKEQFFRDLTVQLSLLPEEIVASQLASLLLSRIVILDEAAQQHLLPIVLQPKTGKEPESGALFTEGTFKRHIIPKLLNMFYVRDAPVRMILLTHFRMFCRMFTTEQLKHQVLPELLIGIKDVNDQLVSMTLKALADLVLILGASTVVGRKRGKLFTDGRPKYSDLSSSRESSTNPKERDKSSPANHNSHVFGSSDLPERLSPDGGEDNTSNLTVGGQEVDGENWSDWESQGERDVEENNISIDEKGEQLSQSGKTDAHFNQQPLPDITTLDIKFNQRTRSDSGKDCQPEIDFFRDMEPIISKTQSLDVNLIKTKFDINADPEVVGKEWAEDWSLEDDSES